MQNSISDGLLHQKSVILCRKLAIFILQFSTFLHDWQGGVYFAEFARNLAEIIWFYDFLATAYWLLTKKVLGENLCNCKDDFSMKFWLFSVVERWGHLLKLWLEKRRENWGEKWERQWGRRCHQRERRRKLRRQRTMRKKIPPKRKEEEIEKKEKIRWQGGQWGEAAGWKLGDFLSKSSFGRRRRKESRRKVINRVIKLTQGGSRWHKAEIAGIGSRLKGHVTWLMSVLLICLADLCSCWYVKLTYVKLIYIMPICQTDVY